MDMNDTYCDYCKHPDKHRCYERNDCAEHHPIFECCEDNLKKNVAEICFKYNLSQQIAVALIKILEKERERNEFMYIHREHIEKGRSHTDIDNLFS